LRAEPRGVLLVAATFDARGGLQRRLDGMAALAARHGAATVLTWRRGLRWSRERRPDGVEVIRLPALAGWERDHAPALAFANAAFSVAVGTAAALALRRRWHVAFGGGLNPEGVVAATAARLLGRPFLLRTWLPGSFGNVARLDRSPLAPALRRLLHGATAVVTETPEMGEEVVAAGFDPRRIVLQDVGVSLGRFTPVDAAARQAARRELGLDGDGVVVYCGRFDLRQKRLDLLLEAWQRAELTGWRLVLVGSGPDRTAVERRAAGVDGVVLRDWQEDVVPYLAAADAAVLPTRVEGNAGGVLEALSCGLPMVVSATPMYRRLAPPGTILAGGVDDWVAALRSLAGDRALRARLGKAGRAWIERRHDSDEAAGRLVALLGLEDAVRPAR